ncbi:hypothetical protein CIB48_g4110 [Xylaria polymorpha]|nr:hypothetical protein CIB48_g4110 [Xylaria polymorpha]
MSSSSQDNARQLSSERQNGEEGSGTGARGERRDSMVDEKNKKQENSAKIRPTELRRTNSGRRTELDKRPTTPRKENRPEWNRPTTPRKENRPDKPTTSPIKENKPELSRSSSLRKENRLDKPATSPAKENKSDKPATSPRKDNRPEWNRPTTPRKETKPEWNRPTTPRKDIRPDKRPASLVKEERAQHLRNQRSWATDLNKEKAQVQQKEFHLARPQYQEQLEKQQEYQRRQVEMQMQQQQQQMQTQQQQMQTQQQQMQMQQPQTLQPSKDNSKLQVHLDLNLEVEVSLKARVHGDLTLSLLSWDGASESAEM